MIFDSFSASPGRTESMISPVDPAAALVHPKQLGVQEFASYALVIDARSPHEFAEDHVPGAVNLPVVDDAEFAEVGIRHKTDQHGAYLVGVAYSLRNIADQIKPLISRYTPQDRFLVYCFRGGKRSRLWADNLRTIGFEVDVLAGGWKNYRRWVRASLDTLSRSLRYRVLCGPTGSGKTRLLHELRRQGEQVLELEELAHHRGSLLGDLPGDPQPTPKLFVSALLAEMRTFDAGGSCGWRPRARSTPERVRSKLESGPGQQRARYGERCSTQASATPFNDQPQARQCRRRPSGASARAAGAVLRRRIGS